MCIANTSYEKKKFYLLIFTCYVCFLKYFPSFGQLILNGTTSIKWAAATNRTAALPLATTDVIIGDANFTGNKIIR